ncbi:hypothetical protein ACFQZ4_51035 [Catellatospora coxensis]
MAHVDEPAPTPYAPPEPGTVTAYRNATLIDGTGAPARPGITIVVDGDVIIEVIPDADATVPDGVAVVDVGGAYVIPGLIDSHQHLATPPNRPVAEAALRRQVYGGVTAIRDMADDLRQIADLTRATRIGEIPGPDIHYASLMAGPSFFDDPRTWQVSQGGTPATSPGCRPSTTTPTCPSRSPWPAAPTPPPSRCTPNCPARPSPPSPPRPNARASPYGPTPRCSPPRPPRSSRPASTPSPTSRCSLRRPPTSR